MLIYCILFDLFGPIVAGVYVAIRILTYPIIGKLTVKYSVKLKNHIQKKLG